MNPWGKMIKTEVMLSHSILIKQGLLFLWFFLCVSLTSCISLSLSPSLLYSIACFYQWLYTFEDDCNIYQYLLFLLFYPRPTIAWCSLHETYYGKDLFAFCYFDLKPMRFIDRKRNRDIKRCSQGNRSVKNRYKMQSENFLDKYLRHKVIVKSFNQRETKWIYRSNILFFSSWYNIIQFDRLRQ